MVTPNRLKTDPVTQHPIHNKTTPIMKRRVFIDLPPINKLKMLTAVRKPPNVREIHPIPSKICWKI
jgi:hypothetical protein